MRQNMRHVDPSKLYVLEKTWVVESRNFVLNSDKFDSALIRPCNVDYKTYKNFVLGKKVGVSTIIHEGCVAYWYRESWRHPGPAKSYEEFLIQANVNKLAFPLFENWMINCNWKTYTVKTIDLKTGKVLYDSTSRMLSEIVNR